MKRHSLKLYYCLLLIITISCSNNDDNVVTPMPAVSSYDISGALGEIIIIEGEDFSSETQIEGEKIEILNVKVFFDESRAQILNFSKEKLEVVVPRNLERHNLILQIIDLETDKSILSTNFTLKKPVITSFDSNEVTFDENLIIRGENFDDTAIEVLINDEKAKILYYNSNEITIQIPYEIIESELRVKVRAQFQESITNTSLNLKEPIISFIENEIAWLRGQLILKGENFHPDHEYGEIYINNIKSHFTASNSEIKITVPYGPYTDFYITDITYKTAGLESNYTTNLEIGNVGIMVDDTEDLQIGRYFTYNNKAYTFSETSTGSLKLYEFSPITEKWTKIDSIEYKGYLSELTLNNNFLFIYITVENSTHQLIKINLDDFSEEIIEFPFHESLNDIKFFTFNDNLYVLYGEAYINNQTVESNEKYKYSLIDSKWEVLGDDVFTESVWKSFLIKKIIHKKELYFSFGITGNNYKLENDLSLTPLSDGLLLLSYKDVIIARQLNSTSSGKYFYDLFDRDDSILLNIEVGTSFFTLNDIIYYPSTAVRYNGIVKLATFKMKEGVFNDIL